MKVAEILEEIRSKSEDSTNMYSDKRFKKLMKAMANDDTFEELVAEVKSGEYLGDKKYNPAKELRKWCVKVVQKAGVDKEEAKKVLEKDFVIDDVEGLPEFFAATLYEFMAAGNAYDIIPKKDLKASIRIGKVDEKVRTISRNPQTGESITPYDMVTEAHRAVSVKNPSPKYLKHRK